MYWSNRTLAAIVILATLIPASSICGDVLYVDDDAPGANDGSSWPDAFVDLQDALAVASTNGAITEVRVAQGCYTPDRGSGDRTAAFQLINDVTIYGGYTGWWGADPDERNVESCETILSGDLFGNDGPDFANNDENSHHVVNGSDTDRTAILDGCVVAAGNANGLYPHDRGGGMYLFGGSPTLVRCIFRGNWADKEGAGVMVDSGSSPALTGCTIADNVVNYVGGGMFNRSDSDLTLTNCTFSNNTAGDAEGGGFYHYSGSATLVNCAFHGNWAADSGGGLYSFLCTLSLMGCTFIGNQADNDGGGVYAYAANDYPLVVTNCAFSGNSASIGRGMYVDNRFGTGFATISNCVLWQNGGASQGAQLHYYIGTPFLRYCCVQGWTGSWGGLWNNGNDPLFVDADGPDGIPGTEDDNLRLTTGSSCIDSGDNDAVPVEVTTDLDGNARFVDDPETDDAGAGTPPIVDRGPYEYRSEDCNGNGVWDADDIAVGTSQDCNSNGTPDECDVAHHDCNTNGVPDECDPDFDGDGLPDGCDPDEDDDGVLNEADACAFTPWGEPVNGHGGPMGDFDDDCAVTVLDYAYFEVCLWFSGPGGDPGFDECTDVFDYDGDGDVDLGDFAAFQHACSAP
ncbi:MAG: right-handed parallel beta-helix repeat-containing protein [bacterium]|nr:right-handed parallel beta-helix repeat-containing protein [bacterium]